MLQTSKGCSLLSLNQFYLNLSFSQPTHHTKHLLLCPPFKRVKVFSALSSEKIWELLPTTHETVFVFDLLNLPWTLLTFFIPNNQRMCWRFYYQTLQDCSVLFLLFSSLDYSARLRACLSVNGRKRASTLQIFTSFLLCLTSICSISEKNGLTA